MYRRYTGGGHRALVCLKSHLFWEERESWRQDFGARTPPGLLGWTEASSGNIIKKISFANSPNHSHKNSNKNMLMWLKTGHHTQYPLFLSSPNSLFRRSLQSWNGSYLFQMSFTFQDGWVQLLTWCHIKQIPLHHFLNQISLPESPLSENVNFKAEEEVEVASVDMLTAFAGQSRSVGL